jgi:hypothetical protein
LKIENLVHNILFALPIMSHWNKVHFIEFTTFSGSKS